MKFVHFNVFLFLTLFVIACQNTSHIDSDISTIFYVSAQSGDDSNSGTIDLPFQTLAKALEVVTERVQQGIRSDKIYLREGRYKKMADTTLYRLELKGTPDDYAELSAMPCGPNTAGCVQRKSGRWYEKVVFDAAWEIDTPWEKVSGREHIWKTNPGYTNLEWTHQNLWPWTRSEKGFPITDEDETPETTSFTVAPYMVLQDGEPTVWVDYVDSLSGPGQRTYDHETGELYVWPHDNKNPNTSTMSIRNNIFSNNQRTIDPALLKPHENSNIYIGHNLFYQNEQSAIGSHSGTRNPAFRSPEGLDFRPQRRSWETSGYHYYGPYPPDGSYMPGTDDGLKHYCQKSTQSGAGSSEISLNNFLSTTAFRIRLFNKS